MTFKKKEWKNRHFLFIVRNRVNNNMGCFLELGILPIEYEIHIRQLSYLHRILNLEEDDPVFIMWQNMKNFSQCGEANWWTDVSNLLENYELNLTLPEMKAMSKAVFKKQ